VSREGGWHRSVIGVVRRTAEAAAEDNVGFLASAISFDLLLTTIPFVVLLLGAVGYVIAHQSTVQQVDVGTLLSQMLPVAGVGPAALAEIERLVANLAEHRASLTLLGIPLFLWFSTRLFGGLRAALNEVFDVDETRPLLLRKLMDLGVVILVCALLVANGYLLAMATRVERALEEMFLLSWLYRFAVHVLSAGFSVAVFFTVFKLLPGRRIYWRTALFASLFCAVAFEVAKGLYALYLTRFATLDTLVSNANIVAFLLFLLWIYYMALVFLLGGEVAETYDLIRMRRRQRVRLA
jgi:membrane protein